MESKSRRPDDEDITETVNEFSSSLYKISLMIIGNAHDAEDAVQETFLKYITKAPSFSEGGQKRAWLTKVAVNISKDKRRYNTKHDHLNFDDLENYLVCEERTDDEYSIPEFLKLPEKYRRAIYLRYVEEMDVASIARAEGITVFAAKQRLKRGKAMLIKEREVNK